MEHLMTKSRARTGRGRRMVAVVLALLMGGAGLAWIGQEGLAGSDALAVMAPLGEGSRPVRIHVVPHSDEAWDQQVKLRVRDAVLAEIGRILATDAPPEGGWLDWGRYTPRLEARARQVLEEVQAPYGARVLWQEAPLSPRHRRQMDLPGDTHWTLQVILGQGNGGNWWCVMFPPLCFVEPGLGFSLLPREAPLHGEPRDGTEWGSELAGVGWASAAAGAPAREETLGEGVAGGQATGETVGERAVEERAGPTADSEPAIRVGFRLLSQLSPPVFGWSSASDELFSWWTP